MPETCSVGWEDQILPDYEIVEQLGISDHSTVYRALDHTSGDTVAIKHIPAPRSKEAARGGLREVSLLVSLDHPNLVNCLDVRYLDNGDFLIIYEFISDGDLRRLLNSKGCFDLNEWIELTVQLFTGLEYLHSQGIIHCDLKPENILVAPSPNRDGGRSYKIADFGVAHYFAPRATVLTKGTGSPAYMAPETFAGRATPESDLYSTGIILYEMITGERPFRGGVRELARSHSHEPPDLNAIAWPSVRVLLSLLLQKQVAHRASDLVMLQQIVSHIHAEPMVEPLSRPVAAPEKVLTTHTFTRASEWIEPDSLHLGSYARLGAFNSTFPFSELEPVSLSGEPFLLLGDTSRFVLNSADTAASRDVFYALNERPCQIFSGDGFATSNASQIEIWNSAKFDPQHTESLGVRVSHIALDEATMDLAWVEGNQLYLRALSGGEASHYPLPFPPGTTLQSLSFIQGRVVLVFGLLNPQVFMFNESGDLKSEIRLPGPIIQRSTYGIPEFLCWKNSGIDGDGPVVVRLRMGSHLKIVETELVPPGHTFIRFSAFGALLESDRGELLLVGPGGETYSLGTIPEKIENPCMAYSLHGGYFYIYSNSKRDNRIIIYRKKGI